MSTVHSTFTGEEKEENIFGRLFTLVNKFLSHFILLISLKTIKAGQTEADKSVWLSRPSLPPSLISRFITAVMNVR